MYSSVPLCAFEKAALTARGIAWRITKNSLPVLWQSTISGSSGQFERSMDSRKTSFAREDRVWPCDRIANVTPKPLSARERAVPRTGRWPRLPGTLDLNQASQLTSSSISLALIRLLAVRSRPLSSLRSRGSPGVVRPTYST